MDISSSSTASSYKVTFGGRIIAESTPGTSTPGSSENEQSKRHLADSDSYAGIELMLSNLERTIRRMETKICTLRNLNQQEKESREVLQESYRRLEGVVRARENEVADLKRQLLVNDSGQEKRKVVQKLGARNSRHRDIASDAGRDVELAPPPQPSAPPIEENIDPGPTVQHPWGTASGPRFVGGFIRPALRKT